jgi:hypothetical protein
MEAHFAQGAAEGVSCGHDELIRALCQVRSAVLTREAVATDRYCSCFSIALKLIWGKSSRSYCFYIRAKVNDYPNCSSRLTTPHTRIRLYITDLIYVDWSSAARTSAAADCHSLQSTCAVVSRASHSSES